MEEEEGRSARGERRRKRREKMVDHAGRGEGRSGATLT